MIYRVLFIGFLFMTLAGCTISFPQVDSVRELGKALMGTSEGSAEENKNAIWLAEVGYVGEVMKVYFSEDLWVFANSDGNAIAFDGWSIRSIIGFGFASPIYISENNRERSVIFEGERFTTTCDDWQRDGSLWSQECVNASNSITLNDRGAITRISMSLGPKIGVVTLKLFK